MVSKYTATETAPVAKDVANYMLAGTRDELAKTISAVRQKKYLMVQCMEVVELKMK